MTALTLTDFLRARLDEDEAVAREAFEAAGREPVSLRPMEGAQTAGALSVMEMLVRWHPARVLADVEAKRQIVEEVARPCPTCLNGKRCVEHDASAGASTWRFRYDRDEHLARLLALPYADHPDYDERWRA